MKSLLFGLVLFGVTHLTFANETWICKGTTDQDNFTLTASINSGKSLTSGTGSISVPYFSEPVELQLDNNQHLIGGIMGHDMVNVDLEMTKLSSTMGTAVGSAYFFIDCLGESTEILSLTCEINP